MNRILAPVVLWALVLQSGGQWGYPPSRTVDATDTYFGRTYKDPYRWLENLKDKDVEGWFKAQADLTDTILAKILRATRSQASGWSSISSSPPVIHKSLTSTAACSTKRRSAARTWASLFPRRLERRRTPSVDPTGFTPKGAKPGDVATIVSYVPSPDGRYVVLGLSAAGAEYSELRSLDVDSRNLLPETLYPSYGPLSWMMDSKSFLYDAGKVTDIKSPEIELNRKTRLHTLGTDVSADADFFSNESYPDLGITAKEMPMAFIDESYPDYVVGNVGTVQNEMRLFYAPTSQMKAAGKLRWAVLATPADNLVRGLVFYKDHVYAVTHAGRAEVQDRAHACNRPGLEEGRHRLA